MLANVKDHQKFIELFPETWMKANKAEQEISLHIYQYLARKVHPDEKLLSDNLPYSTDEIKSILEPLSAGIYRNQGNIIGFTGLTTQPMPHSLEIDGTTTYAWCALDTLFIPELLGKQVLVTSKDPITKNPISFTVDVDQVQPKHTNMVLSMVDPDAEELAEDIVGSFCHFIHFFESIETGKQWIEDHPDTYLISLNEALEIAHLMNKTRYNQYFS